MPEPVTGTVTSPLVDPAQFRSLMATHPAGVAIVTTTASDGVPWGLTCSSVCSVALQPPTLLVCLRAASPTLAALLAVSTFAVNLLRDHAERAAQLFASGAPDRFEKVAWAPDPASGMPHLVDDAHTTADCRVSNAMPVGDHVVVFGTVLRIRAHAVAPVSPLLYGMRRYWSLAGTPPSEPSGPDPDARR
ncbi:flavin reductase family protein [Micromonospora sp. DT48]|uniref:flavin reductase family protein n=1 Tax=unclassified Micromonospora TaxID=2617518 RepID=UPI0012BBE650|nr:flavin reductase family protein [Micromonospora sp. CP22]MTK05084.1 flavin reductase family protein [Micromonospora sp. CP22]